VVVELATEGTTFFHGAHELVSAAVKVNGFCMSEAGLSVRGDLRNNRKPQRAKTVLPNEHSNCFPSRTQRPDLLHNRTGQPLI